MANARAVLELVTDTSGVDPGLNKVRGSVAGLTSELKGMAGTMGLAFGVAAVVGGLKSLIGGTFAYAENISDLAARMAVSTTAAQQWKFAAEQSGSSIETVAKASTKLSTELDGGGNSVRAALKAAGLEFDAIRKMKPEDAFNASVAAVAKIPDPMTQARVATELFGKAGAELLPAIRNGFAEVAAGASTMSEQTIKDLDNAKDSWEALGNSITVWTGKAIAGIGNWTGKAIAGIGNMGEKAGGFVYRLSVLFTEGREALNQYDAAAADLERTQGRLNTELEKGAGAAAAAAEAARKKAAADAALKLKQEALAASAARLAEAFKKQNEEYTGVAAQRNADELLKRFNAITAGAGFSEKGYEKFVKQVVAAHDEGAVLDAKLWDIYRKHLLMNPAIKVSTDAYKGLAGAMNSIPLGMAPPPLSLPVTLDTGSVLNIGQQLGKLADAPEFIGTGTRIAKAMKAGLKDSLMDVGQIIGGALLNWQAGGSVDPVSLGQSIGGGIGRGIGNALGGPAGAEIGALLGGLFGGTIGKMFKNEGRDKAKDFAEGFGGFDGLRQKMLALGAEGDRLWIQLTQNSKGPKQVAATIKLIEDAFAKTEEKAKAAAAETERLTGELGGMRDRLSELQGKSEPTWRDMESAADRLGIKFEKLGPIFAQQKLTEQATEVWGAIDTLRRGGTDLASIMADSKDELQALALESMKAGVSIPGNFRDMYQAMADNGELLDANGEKMNDLSGLRFGDPVKSQWEIIGDEISKLTQSIADLVKQLGGGMVDAAKLAGQALRDLPDSWEFAVKPNFGDGYAFGGHGGGAKFGGAMAKGGFTRVHRPTLFLAGEKPGGEDVAFSGAGKRFERDSAINMDNWYARNFSLPASHTSAREAQFSGVAKSFAASKGQDSQPRPIWKVYLDRQELQRAFVRGGTGEFAFAGITT